MSSVIRNFFFDLSQAPVNSQFFLDAKNIVFEVGGGGPFPSGGYFQVDSNPPVQIGGAIKLNIGFVQKVRFIQIVLPQAPGWGAGITISNLSEVSAPLN
ncbi:MAG: hypothetical protein NUW37_15965 [Planctomycetes bacterium]|nr:hypothetical protein [Planctomycetota bacterium]